MGLTPKYGASHEHDLSSDFGIDLDDRASVPILYAPLVRTVASKYAFLLIFFSSSCDITQVALPQLLNKPTAEQAVIAKNLWREHSAPIVTRVGSSKLPPRHPRCWLPASLGLWTLLPYCRGLSVRWQNWTAPAPRLADKRALRLPVSLGATSPTQYEVLQGFFKSLLNPRDRAASPGPSIVSPGAAAGEPAVTGLRTSSTMLLLVLLVGVEVRRQILKLVVGRKVG